SNSYMVDFHKLELSLYQLIHNRKWIRFAPHDLVDRHIQLTVCERGFHDLLHETLFEEHLQLFFCNPSLSFERGAGVFKMRITTIDCRLQFVDAAAFSGDCLHNRRIPSVPSVRE